MARQHTVPIAQMTDPAPDRGIREIKDAMYRDILARFKEAGIAVASSTYDIVGFPPIRIEPMPVQPPQAPKKP